MISNSEKLKLDNILTETENQLNEVPKLLDKVMITHENVAKIIDENQLIRARNIVLYDTAMRDSFNDLILDDSLDEFYKTVDYVKNEAKELRKGW